jgi:hypothetical protein
MTCMLAGSDREMVGASSSIHPIHFLPCICNPISMLLSDLSWKKSLLGFSIGDDLTGTIVECRSTERLGCKPTLSRMSPLAVGSAGAVGKPGEIAWGATRVVWHDQH